VAPFTAMYASIPTTGHRGHPVFPTKISTACRNWSVLDCFNFILSNRGADALSVATSPQLRCFAGSNAPRDGIVISPDRKNPKKHVTAAAQSVIVSGSLALVDQ